MHDPITTETNALATVRSGQPLFNDRENAVYTVLPHVEPGLMLDVGAAAGIFSRVMLDQSPQSSLIAFEPFLGNHTFWEKELGSDPRARLIKAAVAETRAHARFYVSTVVTGSEKNWEGMAGYSSAGRIVPDSQSTDPAKTFNVDTVTIDDVVGDQHVRFMKIDVQGGELGVLKSASRAIDNGRIDMLFVEFSGEKDVIGFLAERGFQMFDSEYLLSPKAGAALSAWQIFRGGTLSTGRPYHYAWPTTPVSPDPMQYCDQFDEWKRSLGGVWTDLLCIRPGYYATFAKAAQSAREAGVGISLKV